MSRIKYLEENQKKYHILMMSDEGNKISDVMNGFQPEPDEDVDKSIWSTFWDTTRELILEINEDGHYALTHVIAALDLEKLIVIEAPFISHIYENLDNKDIKEVLALAMGMNIPIFGDNKELQDIVDVIQKEIIEKGITRDEDTYKLVKYKDYDFSNETVLDKMIESGQINSAEIKILQEKLFHKHKEYTNAANFIEDLQKAIVNLEKLLESEGRIENKLQKCLTENPILFGTEYLEIIPKHRLGSEYEMDYALKRQDGVFDLVEIEASNLKLFTQKGNPTQHLTHAEQQVIDWLTWIEEKNFYAREKLTNITSPKGIIIIGRSKKQPELEKLIRSRNNCFSNIQISTYDDLINKARLLLDKLKKGKK